MPRYGKKDGFGGFRTDDVGKGGSAYLVVRK